MTDEIIKATPADAGCWIDGHWGQYATARMIEIAADHGYVDHAAEPPFATSDCVAAARRELQFTGPNMANDTRTDEEQMADSETVSSSADDVESWLNDNVAPDGYYFEWGDGEFFLRQTVTVWTMLESPPDGCEATADLYSWSTNYDAGKGPFSLFADLIGWSDDNFGEPIYSLDATSLGYLEIGKLAAALNEYADHPHEVRAFVDELIEAEGRD